MRCSEENFAMWENFYESTSFVNIDTCLTLIVNVFVCHAINEALLTYLLVLPPCVYRAGAIYQGFTLYIHIGYTPIVPDY